MSRSNLDVRDPATQRMRGIFRAGGHMYAVSETTRTANRGLSRPQANASDTSPIQVCLFGGLTLLKKGEPIAWRGGAKTEALLLSLALEESRGVCRERLLSQLWPDSEPSLAAQSLHSLLHS